MIFVNMTDSDGVYALVLSDGVGLVNVNVCVSVQAFVSSGGK